LTISTLLLMMIKGRPTLSGQAIIKDTFTYGEGKQTAAEVLKAIFITAFSIEAAGALFLYLRTAPDAGWEQGRLPGCISCRQRLLQRRVLPLPGQLRRLS
jgi:trk system potassium uptake protein TrkH